MKSVFSILLLLLMPCSLLAAGEREARELFGVYAVTTETGPETKPYLFEGAVDQKPHSGRFKGPAILGASDLKAVKKEAVEIMTAPFSGLSFELSADGVTKLQTYLKKPGSGSLVVIVDGHAYSTVEVPFMREFVKKREPLVVIFPGPYEQTTQHLIELLLEKFETALKAARDKDPAPPVPKAPNQKSGR